MNYYAVERSTDHLAHYGVKGMRWGVRKAIARGNTQAVDKHYAKAAKKLAKLQDIGLNSSKYAKRAAAYGAAAIGTGTIAIEPRNLKNAAKIGSKGSILAQNPFGKISLNSKADGAGYERSFADTTALDKFSKTVGSHEELRKWTKRAAGVATVGLGAAAGLNAYRAASGRKYRQKAYEWKNAMDDTFVGTKYAGKYSIPNKPKKKRR